MPSTFPKNEILFKIFLTLPICNASGERSFSAIKRIKNYLRSIKSGESLNGMAVLYIEEEILKNVDTSKIIEEFAKEKSRKKYI